MDVGYVAGEEIVVPLKNGEGGYVADTATLDLLEERGPGGGALRRPQPQRLLPRHRRHLQRAGNVVGLMPHPEHAIEELTGPSTDGLAFFTSVLKGLVSA